MPNGPSTPPPALDIRADAGVVDSLRHPQAVAIGRLLTHAEPDAPDPAILIDDEGNILEALEAGVALRSVFHSGDATVSGVLRLRLPARTPVYEVARRTCKKLFRNDKVSRIFAIAEAPARPTLESLISMPRDIVALDRVSIAGNVGAIVRTSLAMRAGAVVLLDCDNIDVNDRRLIRASRGHVFALPVLAATTDELVRLCRRTGRPIVVASPRAIAPVDELASLPQGLAVVFGSERRGCSQALTDAASFAFTIPMSLGVESLNVSTAAAMTLYCRYAFNSGAP
jgi:TrmH family RNA methyltransferase